VVKKVKIINKMVAGVVTYSSRITPGFISRTVNVISNVEVCNLKSVKLKIESLGGSERRLC
jgi:hypothetical protein